MFPERDPEKENEYYVSDDKEAEESLCGRIISVFKLKK